MGALLISFVLVPFSIESTLMGLAVRVLVLLVFCIGGYLLFHTRNWVVVYLTLAIPALFFGVVKEILPGFTWISALSDALTALLLLLLFVAVIRFSLYHPNASKLDRIVAGISGYLILAWLWGNLYQFVDRFMDNGFRTPEGVGHLADNGAALYYSVVTITTLGYGDITPVNPWMSMLSSLEAICGTLFLGVFIASMISREK
jgi:hypothetical protein